VQEVFIPTDLNAAKAVAERVLEQAKACRYSEETIFAIKLAMEEALINAIKHGNRNDPGKQLQVEFALDGRQAVIRITDQGNGFCPDDLPDPTAEENIEFPCGRGVMLIKAFMDEVKFNDRGNSVRMVKYNT